MLKVVMNGSIESLSTAPALLDAMTILRPAINNPNASGRVENMETGEVLAIVENGNVVYLSPETELEMLDAIFDANPMLGLRLAIELMGTLIGD